MLYGLRESSVTLGAEVLKEKIELLLAYSVMTVLWYTSELLIL